MIDWDSYFERECELIAGLLPPPSRAEVIKAVWASVEPAWYVAKTADDRLHVAVDGLDEILTFEALHYADAFVVECEGVVVHRITT